MSEIKPNDINEVPQPKIENQIQPENGMTLQESKGFWNNTFQDLKGNNIESSDKKDVNDSIYGGEYTTFEERMKQTPKNGERGKFEGERANSKFVPSDETEAGARCKEKLAEYGLDGIEYKNGEADFSKVSEATLQIDKMTENMHDYYDNDGNRQEGNFTQADKKLAEQWNMEAKDGKTDWTEKDVAEYRSTNNLSWHERCDTKTMDLVPREIHEYCSHSGGRAECRIRDNNNGGSFDE